MNLKERLEAWIPLVLILVVWIVFIGLGQLFSVYNECGEDQSLFCGSIPFGLIPWMYYLIGSLLLSFVCMKCIMKLVHKELLDH